MLITINEPILYLYIIGNIISATAILLNRYYTRNNVMYYCIMMKLICINTENK